MSTFVCSRASKAALAFLRLLAFLEESLLPMGLEEGSRPCPEDIAAKGLWVLGRGPLGTARAAEAGFFLERAVLVPALAAGFPEAVSFVGLAFLRGLVVLVVVRGLSVFLLAGGSSLSFSMGHACLFLYGLASHVKSRVIVDLSTEMLEIP